MAWFGKDSAGAIPGSETPMAVETIHFVTGLPIVPPFPDDTERLVVGMGCFWGAERRFWQTPGVYSTAVGYSGGTTPNPTYEETCTGRTGHVEVVLVVFRPAAVSLDQILKLFWEGHDPTQGDRQGNDVGTQYRSAIYASDQTQLQAAMTSRDRYQVELSAAGYGPITTEIGLAGPFYYAETYHQQYLAKNPDGYCGLGGTGVACPTGVGRPAG